MKPVREDAWNSARFPTIISISFVALLVGLRIYGVKLGPGSNGAGDAYGIALAAWYASIVVANAVFMFGWRQRQQLPFRFAFWRGMICVALAAAIFVVFIPFDYPWSLLPLAALTLDNGLLAAIGPGRSTLYGIFGIVSTIALAYGGYILIALLLYCC